MGIHESVPRCRERGFPRRIHALPRLPRTSLGKIDHSALLAAIAEKETPTS
jgi:acyl-coenzyme A synthetase/AMP-(fatty) acid ligase